MVTSSRAVIGSISVQPAKMYAVGLIQYIFYTKPYLQTFKRIKLRPILSTKIPYEVPGSTGFAIIISGLILIIICYQFSSVPASHSAVS